MEEKFDGVQLSGTMEVNSQLHAAANFTPRGNNRFITRPILSSTNKSIQVVSSFYVSRQQLSRHFYTKQKEISILINRGAPCNGLTDDY